MTGNRYLTYQARVLDFFKDYLNNAYNLGNNTQDVEYFSREKVLDIWTNQKRRFEGYKTPVSRARVFYDLYHKDAENLEKICEKECELIPECETPYNCKLHKKYAIQLLKDMDKLHVGKD